MSLLLTKVHPLRRRERPVRPAHLRHQRLVRPLLHDLPLGEHDDVVRPAHGGEPVGYGDGGAVSGGGVEGGLDDVLGADVDGGGGLVEDQDLGAPDEGAGYG
jgi:hypothetical protein